MSATISSLDYCYDYDDDDYYHLERTAEAVEREEEDTATADARAAARAIIRIATWEEVQSALVVIASERKKHRVDHMNHTETGGHVRNDDSRVTADAVDDDSIRQVNDELGTVERRQHLSVTEVRGEGDGRHDVVGEDIDEELNRDIFEAVCTDRSKEVKEGLVHRREDGEFRGRVCDGIEESSGDDCLDKDGQRRLRCRH